MTKAISQLEENHQRLEKAYSKNQALLQTSIVLMERLRAAVENYKKESNKEQLRTQCMSAITTSKKELATHRGNSFVQVIQKILHGIAQLFHSKEKQSLTKAKATFFNQDAKQPLTKSAEVLYDIVEEIENTIPTPIGRKNCSPY